MTIVLLIIKVNNIKKYIRSFLRQGTTFYQTVVWYQHPSPPSPFPSLEDFLYPDPGTIEPDSHQQITQICAGPLVLTSQSLPLTRGNSSTSGLCLPHFLDGLQSWFMVSPNQREMAYVLPTVLGSATLKLVVEKQIFAFSSIIFECIIVRYCFNILLLQTFRIFIVMLTLCSCQRVLSACLFLS